MNTLVLASEIPFPPTSGYRLRMLHLARQLSTEASVELAAVGERVEDTGEPFSLRPLPSGRSRAGALAASLWQPYMAAKLASRAAGRVAALRHWDTVQAESPFLLPAALRSSAPVVLDAHNVETEIAHSLARCDGRALHRLRWRWEATKTARFESRMLRSVAAVCATSDRDAGVLEVSGARRVVVAPNGVDTSAITHRPPAPGATLIYVGHFGYLPNRLAAAELVDEVLPRVRGWVPEARLKVVGKEPGPELRRRAGASVEVTGEVTDVVPHLHTARAMVVPLRAGGGTRLKVLEALSAGVPVVSTPFGVAGLDVRDGKHVLLSDSPRDLADQALRVVQDDGLAEDLSRRGRSLVEERYDWSVVARPLIELHRWLSTRK